LAADGRDASVAAEVLVEVAEVAEVRGRRLAYVRTGAGEPLVLLHGGWSDHRDWSPQLSSLAGEFDLVAWDAPGCGRSDDPPGDVDLAYYADALAGLLGALDVGPVHLCGLSFGGGLALEVYHRHPHLVRSLLLVSAYAGWAGSLPPAEVEARRARVLAEAHRPPGEWMDAYLPGFFATDVPQEVLDLTREVMLDVRPAGSVPMLNAFADADLRPVLPTVTVPTLVLHPELDVRAPRYVAEALAAGIPGAELVVLPGVGHVCNLEAPHAFDAAVRTFLRGAGQHAGGGRTRDR
jgi:pimeloyl-ACP methyl ester carboxylesterase